ncbi:MAG TPA: serine/threonine-protein kinase [Terracidiphilus sp.]|nr:serine/threonine-protein kinase [Terracidiphilus sp.]
MKTIGRYEILDELGHGAMGSVFKARDPELGRTVAVKVIQAAALAGDKGEEYRTRFYREARAAGSLAHPGIVPVFDVGEHESTPFMVMEFVEGRTLSAAMRSGERFTLERACDICQQIAEALGHAHRKGVIHRDIKPANIMMTSPEAYGSERPRITDFGLAKMSGNEVTTTGQLLGTPAFMPPEQITGAQIDGRADIFSLGVILYALSSGEQPFHGETVTSMSYNVVYTDPVPPRKYNPAMPPQLEAVVMKCLAKNPAERYQTGEELAHELAGLRGTPATNSVMLSAVPQRASAADHDMTVDQIPRQMSVTQTMTPHAVPDLASSAIRESAPTGTQRGIRGPMFTIAAAAIVAVLGVGGWLIVRHRNEAAQQAAVASATTAPAAQSPAPAPIAASNQAPAPALVPAVDQGSSAPVKKIAAPVAETRPAPSAVPTAPRTPAIDPRTFDPKTNARLKIELSHFPSGVPFTVEMNHKPYLNATSGDKSSFDNVYVPPGVQEFRVVLKAGGQRKTSNIVSDEFKAKKHKTLKIDLQGSNGSAAPGRDAQVIAALK